MSGRRPHPFDIAARILSERVRRGAASEELQAMLRSPGIDWAKVIACAAEQFVLPALAAALMDLGLTASLDAEVAAFLEAVHAANIERNEELRDELEAAVGVLNGVGIEPVLLKGANRLLDRLYPDDGWRMLRDLDLLVPQASLAVAAQAFQRAGYAACGSGSEIRRREGLCQIDLHSEPFSSPKQRRLLSAANILCRARPLAMKDCGVLVPSVEHQLVHLIAHSQIRHLGYPFGRIALCDRLELAALVRWGGADIDWQAVFAAFRVAGYHRQLLTMLLGENEGGWCAVPVPDRIGPLTALQQRRIALQARSRTFGYIGSRVGWCLFVLASQMERSDRGQRRGIENLKR